MSDSAASASPTAAVLSREAIARVDPSDQLGDVLALLAGLRRTPWLAAAFAAMAFVALQTDMIGIPWLGIVLFALAGAHVSRKRNFSATFP